MDYHLSNERMTYQQFVSLLLKWMFIGVGITALTTIVMYVFQITKLLSFTYFPALIAFSVLEIVMVIILVKKIENMSFIQARKYFYIYSIINGITMTFLLDMVAPAVAILSFLMTCAYFGLLYAIVSHTSYDFQYVGKICVAALPILIITYILLFIFQLSKLYYLVILIDLVIFTGITLFDMKNIRKVYLNTGDDELEGMAMICALELYLDFINIFIDILLTIAENA